jgi:hypothetical protein
MKRIIAVVVMLALLAPSAAAAQVPDDVWRRVAERIEVGTELDVRLLNGQRFRAVLVATTDDGVLVQPKTRQTVPVQSVRYDALASLERRAQGGIGAGKAAAIGIGSAVGVFFGLLLILFAAEVD